MAANPLETPVARRLSTVKHIIIVMSGKGGVGKSSSAVQLALSLLSLSPTTTVGLLDLDLTGPSLPRMLGLDGRSVHQSSSGWVPVYADREQRLGCMSIGFLLKDRGDSVVWRGPKKDGMIRQFLAEVRWGNLDYLVIDTPPALNDTLKSLSFARKLSLPVLGLVENMSGYVCPCCGEVSDIFSSGGGEAMATREDIGWLGRVPIDTKLVKLLDEVVKKELKVGEEQISSSGGFPLLDRYKETKSSDIWNTITHEVSSKIKQRADQAHSESLAAAS